MDKEELKKIVKNFNEAVEEEKRSRKNANIISIEIFLISFCIGIACYGGSGIIWVAILAFLGSGIGVTMLVVRIKQAAIIFSGIFSLFWGAFGYAIGTVFKSVGMAILLGFICFLISYKKHLDGIKWIDS